MIAKHIISKGGRNGFKGLAAYVVAEKDGGRGDPTQWKLADYILDDAHGGEKVAYVNVSNCVSTDPKWAVKECLALAEQNTRSKKDKCYHLVVSFPEGEKPTREQMKDIEESVVKAIGFEGHLRISAVHQNTDNWHLHVAIVTIHPVTKRAVTPYYDHLRLQEACQELEIKHGLTRDNHVQAPERPLNGKAKELEAHAGRTSFAGWVKEHAAEALKTAAKEGQGWDDLHRELARFDLTIKPRGAGLVIVHRQDDKFRMKASDVGRDMSMKALADRFGPYQAPAGDIPAPAAEAPAPVPPVDPPAIPPRAPSTPVPPAAPAVPPVPQVAPEMSYSTAPIQTVPEAIPLWERYCAEKAVAEKAKSAAVAVYSGREQEYRAKLEAWYGERFANAKAAKLNRGDRIATFQKLREDRARDRATSKVRAKIAYRELAEQHKIPSWQSFLEREAGEGDTKALTVLRSRRKAQQAITRQIITAKTPGEALDVIDRHHKPFVRNDGAVFYTLGDGGRITDRPTGIEVQVVSHGAVILALDLAARKFPGQQLTAAGDDKFSRTVDRAAKVLGYTVGSTASHKIALETTRTAVHTLSVLTDRAPNDRSSGHTER